MANDVETQIKKASDVARQKGWDEDRIKRAEMVTRMEMSSKRKNEGFVQRNLPAIAAVGVPLALAPFTGGASLGLIPSTLIGAGAAAAGTIGRSKLRNEAIDTKDVGKEALLSGAGNLAGAGIAKVASAGLRGMGNLVTKAVPRESDIAARTFARAFTVPSKLAPRLKPVDTARELIDYGISGSLDKMRTASNAVTGSNGILSQVIRDGAGVVKEISTGDYLKAARNTLMRSGLPEKEINQHMLVIGRMGRPGRLPATMNAVDALDYMRELEELGYRYFNAGTNKMTPNPVMQKVGEAYLSAADELKMSLSKSFKSHNVIQQFKTPEVVMALQQISPKLAQKFMKANTLEEVRALQAPFVRLNQMIGLTEDASQSIGGGFVTNLGARAAGGIVGGVAGGPLGAIAGIAGAPFIEGAEQSVRAPLTTGVAKLMGRFGRGSAIPSTPPNIPGYTRALGFGVGAGVGQNVVRPNAPAEASSEVPPSPQDVTQLPGQSNTIPDDFWAQAMLQDYNTTGGKNLAKIEMLQKAFSGGTDKPATASQAQASGYANRVADASQILESKQGRSTGAGFLIERRLPNIVKGSDAQLIDQAQRNFINATLRRESGAVISPTEFENARLQYLPQPGDDPAVLAAKKQNRERVLASLRAEAMASPPTSYVPASPGQVQFAQ